MLFSFNRSDDTLKRATPRRPLMQPMAAYRGGYSAHTHHTGLISPRDNPELAPHLYPVASAPRTALPVHASFNMYSRNPRARVERIDTHLHPHPPLHL